MAFFKATCAKNNQKIELIVQFNSLEEARENLHKQGYSIIELKETAEYNQSSDVFYFDALIDGKIKHGSINSVDPIKAYIKLVEEIHYNILYFYENKEATENEKILSTQKIKQSFEFYLKTKKVVKKEEKKEEKKEDINKSNNDEIPEFLKKELNHYYILIDKVLEKIEIILRDYNNLINEEKRIKLGELYNALKQVKNITNVTKLKIIGETALIKVGEYQSELIQSNSGDIKKEILGETNKLLKNFGSTKQIILPEDDIKLKLEKIINEYKDNIKMFFTFKKKHLIDKNSGKYYDILREIDVYNKKLRENYKLKFKNLFNKDQKHRIELKIKLIKQNITLLENRIKNKKISYSKTVKGFNYYKDIIIYLIQKFGDLLIYSLLIYSLFFIFYNIYFSILGEKIEFNYNFLIYILLISFLGFFLKVSKNITFLVFFGIFYIFLSIFLIINF